MDPTECAQKILAQHSLTHFEIIPLNRPLSFPNYQDWLKNNQYGDMTYMAKNQDVRESPAKHFKEMKSIIVFEQSYYPLPESSEPLFAGLKIAHYARNKDYHFWFRERLNQLISQLQKQLPNESFMAFTDAVPLLERDHGAQAALGWIGKNTCLIHPKRGSLFFIGEILTSLETKTTPKPLHDFCGSCTACIDQCPTQALTSPRVLDASKCIAYWNIESKEIPPQSLRQQMGDWFFGCDICQTVCPWNMKIHKLHSDYKDPRIAPEKVEEELHFILTQSNKKLLKHVRETPLSRAGGRGLKRNALIVIGNQKLKSLRPHVEAYLDHKQLGELAHWALEQLDQS